MTLGVMQRVEELARREAKSAVDEDGLISSADGRPPFRSMVSLQQVLSETLGVGVNTKRVRTANMSLVETFGNEMKVLLDAPTSDLADALPSHGDRLAEGIERVRSGSIHIEPGFDGQFGVVKVWPDANESGTSIQPLLI